MHVFYFGIGGFCSVYNWNDPFLSQWACNFSRTETLFTKRRLLLFIIGNENIPSRHSYSFLSLFTNEYNIIVSIISQIISDVDTIFVACFFITLHTSFIGCSWMFLPCTDLCLALSLFLSPTLFSISLSYCPYKCISIIYHALY